MGRELALIYESTERREETGSRIILDAFKMNRSCGKTHKESYIMLPGSLSVPRERQDAKWTGVIDARMKEFIIYKE